MVNCTSKTYQMKREILTFSNKISRKLPKPEKKFIADMNYGILASKVVSLQTLLTSYMSIPKNQQCRPPFQTFVKRYTKRCFESLPDPHKEMVSGSSCHSYR